MTKRNQIIIILIATTILLAVFFVIFNFSSKNNQNLNQEGRQAIQEEINESIDEGRREFDQTIEGLRNLDEGIIDPEGALNGNIYQNQFDIAEKEDIRTLEDFVIRDLVTGEKVIKIKEDDNFYIGDQFTDIYLNENTQIDYDYNIYVLKENGKLNYAGPRVLDLHSFSYQNQDYWVFLYAQTNSYNRIFLSYPDFVDNDSINVDFDYEFIESINRIEGSIFEIEYFKDITSQIEPVKTTINLAEKISEWEEERNFNPFDPFNTN